jgi:hypothetical protein
LILCGAVCIGAGAASVAAVAPAANSVTPPNAAAAPAGDRKPAAEAAVNLPSLNVQQIVDRNAAARGGAAAWQQVRSMTLAGKLDAGKVRRDGGQVALVSAQSRVQAKAAARRALLAKHDADAEADKIIQLPFQMDLQRPVNTRLEIPFQGQTAVQVYDGAAGWKLRPFIGRNEVEPFSAEELKIAADQQELDGPLINYAAKGTKVEVVGGEIVEGRGAYKLKLTLKNGDVRHLWVDAQTFLDVKFEGAPRRVDGKMRQVVTYYRDYKPVDGLVIAHRLDTAVESVAGVERIFIEKVELNPTLNDSRFARPQ